MSIRRQDLPSYLSVLKFRGGTTVLVEGPTDKRAIARALHEFERSKRIAPGVVVDSADSLQVPGCHEGNREVVECVHAAARSAGFKVFAVVDREFRQFVANVAVFRDDLRRHYEPSPDVTWTRGHSIENYFFEPEYAQEYLRYRYAGEVASDAIDAVSKYWPEALHNVAAFSVAARDAGLLVRLLGALPVDAWHIPAEGRIEITPVAVENVATARRISPRDAAAFRDSFEALLPAAKSSGDESCSRWIAHGRLADEAMWGAVARVLREKGAPSWVVKEVGSGFRDDKRYHRADRWAQMHGEPAKVETIEPLWRALGVIL